MEDDSNTEQVTDSSVFTFGVFEINNLRSHISWSSTSNKHEFFLHFLSKTKISNNTVKISLLSQKNVLRFQISMHYVKGMHHFQPLEDTFHHHFYLFLCKFMFGLHLIIQLSSFQKFNYDVDGILTLVHLEYFHEVPVDEFSH